MAGMKRREFMTKAGILLPLLALPASIARAATSDSTGKKTKNINGAGKPAQADTGPVIRKTIPSTGEGLPCVGMGTWITFNIGQNEQLLANRIKILNAFFANHGALIDSSPMYGSAEAVLGRCFQKMGVPGGLFAATKIWTSSTAEGARQLADSFKLWGVDKFQLQQVHNLVNWRDHLKMLRKEKEKGRVKYVGITTSHGRRHDELAEIMKKEPLDFVQLTYNMQNRAVEQNLLPIAKDKGIAVIANRPYGGGSVIRQCQRHPLPAFAREAGIKNWPEYLLKYIVSHEAITCAIPATSQVEHMQENMGACVGDLPDAKMRKRMADHVASL